MKLRYLYIITAILIAQNISALKCPSSDVKNHYNSLGCNFDIADSLLIMPHFMSEHSGQKLRIAQKSAKDANPVVRRTIRYEMFFQEAQELLMRAKLMGEEEYADGTIKSDSLIDQMGSFSPSDMVLYGLIAEGVNHTGVTRNYVSSINDNPLDIDNNRYYLQVRESFEIEDNHPWLYKDLRNWTGVRLVKEHDANFWGEPRTLAGIINYGRNIYKNSGKDPDNFDSETISFNPRVGYLMHGIGLREGTFEGSLEETTMPYLLFTLKGSLGLFGRIYCEGGFDENCKTMVITEMPSEPEYEYDIVHTGKQGSKYMDSWLLKMKMTTTQYGIEYVVDHQCNVYLPYPVTAEDKEAAREAGYVF